MPIGPLYQEKKDWRETRYEIHPIRKKRRRLAFLCLFSLLLLGFSLFFYPRIFGLFSDGQAVLVQPIINETPILAGYQNITLKNQDLYQGSLVLVNRNYSCEKIGQGEHVCVYDQKTDSYPVSNKNVLLHRDVMDPLNRMMDAFYQNEGKTDILVTSGFRDYSHQEHLYQEADDKAFVNQPEHSEHHTGYALDLSLYNDVGETYPYDGLGKYLWINQNCEQYGFIVRYAENKTTITGIGYEPWHLRYVGIPHASIMKAKDLALEEYIPYLKDFQYGKQHLTYTVSTTTYEVYYIAATGDNTPIPVPANRPYWVSGNNVDGFVVTAEVDGRTQ